MRNNLPIKLIKAINSLIMGHPFFATITLQRNIIIDDSCNTAWTDGDTIGISNKFIEDEYTACGGIDTIKFTLAHEVIHITNCHHARMGNKDPELWNIACDHADNIILVDGGFVAPKTIKIYCDFKYRGWCAEDIYRDLKANQKNGNKNQKNNQSNNSGGQNNSSSNNEPKIFGEVRPCEKGKEIEKEEEAKIQSKQAERIAKQQGKLPAFIERMFKNIPSNTDWKEALAQFAAVISNNDYSWNVVNPRYSHTGFIFPGLYSKEVGNIIVACDTSGSISTNEISVMVSELFSILENLEAVNKDNLEIPVIYCDSIVQKVEHLQIGDSPKPKGGGGTDFKPPFDYIEKNLNIPAAMIYITDGECNSFPENPGYPVLWALFKNNPSFKPPFGDVIYIAPGNY